MNYGESEDLARRLSDLGHVRTYSISDAELVVLNTCTVVETTEKRMLRRASELRKDGKEVIVAGCMAKVQSSRMEVRLPNALILPPDMYPEFDALVEEKYGCGECIESEKYGSSAILPIAQGCLGNCTYCITRFARGRLVSFNEDELIQKFKKMLDDGSKEILITAQDTACYGMDTGSSLPKLIKRMLEFDGDYRIRIGMMNPNRLDPIIDDLMDLMEDKRLYRFLHIPIQSGSDSVLLGMKRHCTADKFIGIVNRLRERYPDISIATDIISGFPGESDEDHEKSLNLVRTLKADTINITRFSVRPGTDAASMVQVQGRIIKDRSRELTDLKNDVEKNVNDALIGKQFEALVTEIGKPGTVIARTNNYRPVAIEEEISLGTFINVEITSSESTYLIGKLLND